jgi:hypothetical protein
MERRAACRAVARAVPRATERSADRAKLRAAPRAIARPTPAASTFVTLKQKMNKSQELTRFILSDHPEHPSDESEWQSKCEEYGPEQRADHVRGKGAHHMVCGPGTENETG